MPIKVGSGILAELGTTGKRKSGLVNTFLPAHHGGTESTEKEANLGHHIYPLRPVAPLPLKKAWIPVFAGMTESVSAQIGTIGQQIRRSGGGGGSRAMEADSGRFPSLSFASFSFPALPPIRVSP